MALIAAGTAVNVSADSVVSRICLRLRVAGGAHENRKVIGIRMAGGAHTLGVAVIRREPGVIERRSRPGGCRVACLASGGESRCLVVGICGALVFGRVT